MKPKVNIDRKKLSQTLARLSKICKGKLRFFEDSTQYYISEERGNLPFCRMLSRNPVSNALCTRCNEKANAVCREKRAFYCYHCHAHLVEMMYPVVFKDHFIGHISVGQFRSKGYTADPALFEEMARLTGNSPEAVRKAYQSQPSITPEEIQGARLLLTVTAEHLLNSNVFSYGSRDAIGQAEQYIRDHLSEPLSLEKIARSLYMNPTYLCSLYHSSTGQTLFQYIRQERILRAEYLFSSTTLSVAEISRAVGYPDPNYFSKVFKAQVSCSPREYREKLAGGEIIF